jgi:cytochrome c oxidase subunit 1
LNFIVTIHKLRAPGLTWSRLPLFCWAIYATSVIQVLATPVLAITLVLLMMERILKIGIFDPALGGDAVLFQHFFWFYSHPAVYIMILPAMGIISEIIPVFSRKPIFGYRAIAMSSFGIALVAFIVWGHHMFVTGQSELANFVFSLLTMFVAVPTGIKVFSWVGTMFKGKIHFNAPRDFAGIPCNTPCCSVRRPRHRGSGAGRFRAVPSMTSHTLSPCYNPEDHGRRNPSSGA